MVSVRARNAIFEDVELIAFDKDGTLLDFSMYVPIMIKRAELICQRYHLDAKHRDKLEELLGLDPHTHKVIVGGAIHMERVSVIEQVFNYLSTQQVSSSMETVSELFTTVDDIVNMANHVNPYKGVKQLLHPLKKKGIKTIIITHDSTEPAIKQLKAAELADYFEIILGMDLNSPYKRKPSPAMLHYACKKLDISVKKSLVVGDSNSDLLVAKNADALGSIGVTSGRYPADVLTDADVILDSVADIEIID